MTTNLFETLKRYDIEFEIGPEMLKSMMEYMVSFRHELYVKFFSDRMFLQSRSSDNTQYTEIDLIGTGVQNYNANIPEGLEERYKTFTRDEQIKYRNIYVTSEGVHKRVLLSLMDRNPTTPMAELLMFLGKNNIKIRIDTLYEKKIEFNVQRGMYIWWRLMDPNGEDTKAVENMPAAIKRIRSDTTIEKAVLTMEPGLFKRLASLGGKPSSKSGTSHTRAMFETDVNKGLTVASGDNMRGRVLKLGVLGSNLANYDELGNRKKDSFESVNSSDSFESIDNGQKEQPFGNTEEDTFGDDNDNGENDNDKSDSYNEVEEISSEDFVSDLSNPVSSDMFSGTTNVDGEVPFLSQDDISGRSKQSKENKKKDYKKKTTKFEDDLEEQNRKDAKKKSKKKDESENLMDDAITNDLTSAEVSCKTQLWLEIPFLAPILKLNGLAPIMIEMRNGKPLVIIQKPYSDMSVLLTVAPRIETDGDTD